MRAQADQARRLQEEEARAARERGSRQNLVNAAAGRGGPVTLFTRKGTQTLGSA